MGIFSSAKAFAKKKIKARVTESKQRKYAKETIRKKAKAEYWRAKKKEELKLARQTARHEREVAYKKKTAPKKSFFSMESSRPAPVQRAKSERYHQPKGEMPSLVSTPKFRSMVDTPSFEKLTKEKRF